jgi:hypothetical protein
MTKADIKEVVDDLRNGKTYSGVDTSPLFGLALDDFPKGKYVRKEVISNLLNWQCMLLNGEIDEEELDNTLTWLKEKRVVMI